jgi:hypothetical protein
MHRAWKTLISQNNPPHAQEKSPLSACGKLFSKTIHFPLGKEGKPSFLIWSKGFPLGIVEKGGVKWHKESSIAWSKCTGKVLVRCCEARSLLRTQIREGRTRPGMKLFRTSKSRGDFSWAFNRSLFEKLAKWGIFEVDAYLVLIVLWKW